MYLSIPPYAMGSVPSLSGDAFAYRWRSLPKSAGTGPAVLKVVPVTGADFTGHRGPFDVRLSFPTPTSGIKWAC